MIRSIRIDFEYSVESLLDEDFLLRSKANINHYGYTIEPGRIAVLKVMEIKIIVSENTCMIFEPSFYENLGFDFKDFKIVLVKSPVVFRHFYIDIAKSIVLLNCPGHASSDFSIYKFKNKSMPLYPLDKNIVVDFNK